MPQTLNETQTAPSSHTTSAQRPICANALSTDVEVLKVSVLKKKKKKQVFLSSVESKNY